MFQILMEHKLWPATSWDQGNKVTHYQMIVRVQNDCIYLPMVFGRKGIWVFSFWIFHGFTLEVICLEGYPAESKEPYLYCYVIHL